MFVQNVEGEDDPRGNSHTLKIAQRSKMLMVRQQQVLRWSE